jgi:hypothetical protein
MNPSPFDIGTVATTWNQDRRPGASKRYHHVRVIDVSGTPHEWLLTDQERENIERRAAVNRSDIPVADSWWQKLWHNRFWDWLAR